MGTYLATGILQNISFRKKDIPEKVIKENIQDSLRKEVNLECYGYRENNEMIWWEIRPEMLEGNFLEFLEKQFRLYDENNEYLEETLKEIKKASTGQEILELAEIIRLPHFRSIEPIFDTINIGNNFGNRIDVNYRLISFFLDGKIIMECYKNILHYFERNIRLQNKEYPIVECLKIMITR